MEDRIITQQVLDRFRNHLFQEEKSKATVEKYLRDVGAFRRFLQGRPVNKDAVLDYKAHLQGSAYAARSINSYLAGLNSFFAFMGWQDCRVRSLRLQQQIYCSEKKELSKAEYQRLLAAAQSRPQLQLLLQTICSTGIRVSELRHFTVEAVKAGEVAVQCKGKNRRILLPGKLRKLLLRFASREGITQGSIFCGKTGKPLSRGCIWARMKQLCTAAGVASGKVFPHNLRKLFARTFYNMERDVVKLADILGHSSINTTRIYLLSTGSEHRQKLERLGLLC